MSVELAASSVFHDMTAEELVIEELETFEMTGAVRSGLALTEKE